MSNIDDPSIKRRLSAILFADIANYTRLMGADEVGTWRAAKPVIRNMNEMARQHHGRVLQVRGDGLFLLFDSAVDAVRFGMELQRQMKTLNESLEEERQLWFRVGINLGEILVDDDDVSGDSVNVAARLESLARPGHVCISAAVYEQIRNRLTFGYEYLGAQHLKNVKEPIDAFEVHENPASAAMTAGLRRPNLAGAFVHSPIKDLSVVVLPFRFQGGDHAESWIADGLTEDITTSLSRFHDLFVISRMSAYAFAARMRAPAEAARELGVRYVITGSVRKAGRQIRITIELLDAERGRSIWGEHYDRALEDIFDVQDEITRLIVSATAVQIEASERERIRQLAPADLRAYGFVVQGQQHIFRYTRDENREARLLYEAALQVDPRYARALAAKSRTLNIDWRYSWTDLRDEALEAALELALGAVAADPTDARGFGELGFAHLYRKEHEAAIRAYERALSLNPNDADLMSDMADALAHCHRSEEAIALLKNAMRLNPFYPDQYLWHLGGAYFNLKCYEEAIHTIHGMQNPTEGRRLLAASYGHLGRMEEARAEAAKVLQAHPDFSIERWAAVQPDKDAADVAHFVEGLRRAGF
jgi:TolB-like protein/class 3 adenylate cyclase/Flp pilus assembly protein TadD